MSANDPRLHPASGRDGFAMVTVLLTLIVMSVVAAVAIQVSLTDRQASWAMREGEGAHVSAEGGAHREWANWPAKADSLAPGDSLDLGWTSTADGWRYHGMIKRVDSGIGQVMRVLRVEGRTAGNRGGQRVIELWNTTMPDLFPWAIGGRGDVLVDNDALIDSYDSGLGVYGGGNIGAEGDVHSNSDVTISNNSTVNGEAGANGTVTMNNGGVATGGTTNGVTPRDYSTPPCPPPPFTLPVDLPPGPYVYDPSTGDLTVDNKILLLPSGTYHFHDVTVKKPAGRFGPLPGASITVFISGALTVQQQAKLNEGGPPGAFAVFGCGTATDAWRFNNNSEAWGAFYAPDRDIVIENDSDIYGAVVGDRVTVWKGGTGPVSVHYDEALSSFNDAGARRQIPRAWAQIAR